MDVLLLLKEKIKKFAGANDVFIIPVLKFLLTFISISQINSKVGYMERLNSNSIGLIIALLGSFLPLNLTIVILGLVIVAHMYALSLEVAIIVFAVFLILFFIYFRFSSNESVAALLMPVAFILKVPYIVPVSMGLVGTPVSMVSIACGTVVYQLVHYIHLNSAKLLVLAEDGSKVAAFKNVVNELVGNRELVLYAFVFAATVLVVYIVRKLPVDYCWYIAIVGGSVVGFVLMLIGNGALKTGISTGSAFLGMIISIIINIILQYFCFDLNYNRTERVQFEDDEYYYYVKAVPKNTVELPDKKKKKTTAAANRTATRNAPTREVKKPEHVEKAPKKAEEENNLRANFAKALLNPAAAKPANRQGQPKAPFGLTGGRPAGSGRSTSAPVKRPAGEPKNIDNFSEDDVK